VSDGIAAPGSLRHELRTPINQIMGYAELVEEELAERGIHEHTEDLRRIRAAARRLLGLIERIADIDEAAPYTPAVSDAARDAEVAPEAAPVSDARLLVVDDSAENRDVLARRLRGRGFAVETAAGGHEALTRIGEERFDVVLLDVVMPDLGGIEVLRRIRRTLSMSELPVIMATARDASSDVVDALANGANDYVTKPLDLPVVLARLQGQLALKRARDEIHRLAEALEVRNRFIRQTFGRYVSDEVAESLLESPEGLELGGEVRRVTVVTTDIRGFSSLVEMLEPDQVVSMLNLYLSVMADVIFAHRGTIDEFVGDSILAVFGAPIATEDAARRALRCAVAMQLAMSEVNAYNEDLGLPRIEMAVSVNTGDAIVGNIGSQRRAKYGVVGEVINVAARIEASAIGGQILTTPATLAEAGPDIALGTTISMAVKGASDPITVHEVLGVGGLGLPDHDDPPVLLGRPLPVALMLIDDAKRVSAERFAGTIAALSRSRALLRPEGIALEPLASLRLRISGTDHELYGRVVGGADDFERYPVRFTSVSPGAAAYLAQLRTAPA
jgi:adenylate cyclase